jgi:hypothetical protein
MPCRPAFTKQSCKTAQRIERCPDKVRFEKAIPTAGVVGWGKEAEFLSTGGSNASSEIVRHARFMEGHLRWSLAVTVVSCSTVFRWCSSRQSLLVGARFHLPVRDLMPKRAERPEDRGFMHRPLRRLARFEQRTRCLFRGRARFDRYCAGFKLALYMWEIAKNKYRSSDASFVGAALCCEEAGTSNRQALSVLASSHHKAAPTEPRRTNESRVV